MLETVANNVISSINALIDYNILGNPRKTENITISGDMLCRTMIRLLILSYLLASKIALSNRLPKSCPVTVTIN